MDNINVNDISKFLLISPSSNTSTVSVPAQHRSFLTSQPGPSILKPLSLNNKDETNQHWTKDHSLILIDCYEMFRHKVGGMEIRNLKKMWEVIATYIFQKYNLKYTATNYENRWRVLDRNYKKYIENNSKTGRGRKYFEFAERMDAIFRKKRSINPEILLSSSSTTINKSSNEERVESLLVQSEIENIEPDLGDNETNMSSVKTPKTSANTSSKIRRRIQSTKYRKDLIIEQMHVDRKQYQEERLKLEKYKIEQMLEIEREKLKIRRNRNELLETRNKLLEQISKNANFNNLDIL